MCAIQNIYHSLCVFAEAHLHDGLRPAGPEDYICIRILKKNVGKTVPGMANIYDKKETGAAL